MRLLNIKTLKLEWFHNAHVAPSYAILSHRWGREEVLFDDVEEKPEAQKLRSLQKKLEETERRLDALSRKIEGKSQTDALSDPLSIRPGSANTESSVQRSPDTVKSATVTHVHESQAAKPKGWAKVLAFCTIAEQFGISYVWIDTCCIDKNSSTELSESLNSMFAWYRCATLCIAYLSDVCVNWGDIDPSDGHPRRRARYRRHPRNSDWFSRGWTLQELIAPKDVWFYKQDWTFLGIRSELAGELHDITGVQKEILQKNGLEHLHTLSVAARMSWAANRETTRPEDLAYSLLGLFGVNIPIMYGEGERNAFSRLQVMIFQSFSDHSIFAWKALSLPHVSREKFFGSKYEEIDLFAPSPRCFKKLGFIKRLDPDDLKSVGDIQPVSPYSMCARLQMRPLRQGDKLFQEDELRFETMLGHFRIEGNKRRAIMITLAQTGLGRYRRIVQQASTNNEGLDLQVVDSAASAVLFKAFETLNDVLISNPRPSLPPKHHVNRGPVPIALNCATALTAGVEVGGFWGAEGDDMVAENVSGETIYTALLWTSGNRRRDRPYQYSVAFTIRSIKSGETCGIILALLDWETFSVSIVRDLKEQDFRYRGFFDRRLKSRDRESQDLTRDIISYKLEDGTYLFLGCGDQENLSGWGPREQLRVGIVE